MNGFYFQALCSTKENLKRLLGVRDLCIRKLSIKESEAYHKGGNRISRNCDTIGADGKSKSKQRRSQILRRESPPDLKQGVRKLQRIIRMVDCGIQS
jgi:hypothetical protein